MSCVCQRCRRSCTTHPIHRTTPPAHDTQKVDTSLGAAALAVEGALLSLLSCATAVDTALGTPDFRNAADYSASTSRLFDTMDDYHPRPRQAASSLPAHAPRSAAVAGGTATLASIIEAAPSTVLQPSSYGETALHTLVRASAAATRTTCVDEHAQCDTVLSPAATSLTMHAEPDAGPSLRENLWPLGSINAIHGMAHQIVRAGGAISATLPNGAGETPVHLAAAAGDTSMLALLLATVRLAAPNGDMSVEATPPSRSSRHEQSGVVCLLVAGDRRVFPPARVDGAVAHPVVRQQPASQLHDGSQRVIPTHVRIADNCTGADVSIITTDMFRRRVSSDQQFAVTRKPTVASYFAGDAWSLLHLRDDRGDTPIAAAARAGSARCVALLLRMWADAGGGRGTAAGPRPWPSVLNTAPLILKRSIDEIMAPTLEEIEDLVRCRAELDALRAHSRTKLRNAQRRVMTSAASHYADVVPDPTADLSRADVMTELASLRERVAAMLFYHNEPEWADDHFVLTATDNVSTGDFIDSLHFATVFVVMGTSNGEGVVGCSCGCKPIRDSRYQDTSCCQSYV